jgi:hypothetical protein
MHWHNPIIDDRGRIFQLGSRKLDTPDQGRAWGIALRLMQAD